MIKKCPFCGGEISVYVMNNPSYAICKCEKEDCEFSIIAKDINCLMERIADGEKHGFYKPSELELKFKNTFHEILCQYYTVRKHLEEYAAPRLEKMKKGINLSDEENQQLETLDGIVKDYENALYAYRRDSE